MTENDKAQKQEKENLKSSFPDAEFPTEPFPCPACGQMLAPSCRLCVACGQAINPAEIKRPKMVVAIPDVVFPRPAPVRFPWRVFLLVLGIWMIAATAAQNFLGPVRSELVLGGAQILSSGWVFYDAQGKGVPKPLRWGLGSLLLWPFIFPWYLVRRKNPDALCPFVEAPSGPLARTVLLVLLLVIIFLVLRGTPAPK
jgi:hypothetical protein